ncbi:MAG: L,D-transpeptidase [Nitratireductor sp.]|nr:L,D-transpeptidase [Nitratireductor sp.]
MLTRRKVVTALAAGAVVGTGAFRGTVAQARYFDPQKKQWVDGEPVKRRLDQRKTPSKFKRRNVRVQTSQAPGTVIIHTDEKFLYLITGPNKATRYGVGVGREGFGWNGEVTIRRKSEWPVWIPPKEMIAREREQGHILPARMEGGPENPLGARAMYLYQGGHDTMYRIHGTNQPWSIGLNLSSGCIRMMNEDVEHLYDRVEIGTKVVVIGPGQDPGPYLNAPRNPFLSIFNGG